MLRGGWVKNGRVRGWNVDFVYVFLLDGESGSIVVG